MGEPNRSQEWSTDCTWLPLAQETTKHEEQPFPMPCWREEPNNPNPWRRRSLKPSSLLEAPLPLKWILTGTHKSKSKSRGRSSSRRASDPSVGSKRRRDDVDFSPGEGLKNAKQKRFAKELERKSQKPRNRDGRTGESDRHVYIKKNKHLLCGKMGTGTRSSR